MCSDYESAWTRRKWPIHTLSFKHFLNHIVLGRDNMLCTAGRVSNQIGIDICRRFNASDCIECELNGTSAIKFTYP